MQNKLKIPTSFIAKITLAFMMIVSLVLPYIPADTVNAQGTLVDTGSLHKLGTLYTGGTKQLMPTNPVEFGDIPELHSGQTIEIRNTDSDDAYKLQWREVNIDNKQLLIADRNILQKVSWDDLNTQGLIFGKEIAIDGQQYKLRVLSGGSEFRSGSDNFSGGGSSTNNEWDQIIANEANLLGLPEPSVTDLSSGGNSEYGAHNQFWNWYQMWSITQESTTRGHFSAQYFNKILSGSRITAYGWRPVLEVVDIATPVVAKAKVAQQGTAIKDQPQGSEITFAGTQWVVLEPGQGYLISKNKVGNNNNHQTEFNPTLYNGFGLWLNNQYLKSLPYKSQMLIKPHIWTTAEDDTSTWLDQKAKVGLLTKLEWEKYSKQLNPTSGFLENPSEQSWLRSAVFGTTPRIHSVRNNGSIFDVPKGNSYNYALNAAIYISPDLEVVSGAVQEPEEHSLLTNMNPGDIIKFAGRDYVLLDTDTNLIYMKDQLLVSNKIFDIANSSIFKPTVTTNIGYFLNDTWYNTMTNGERSLIKKHEWGIGSLSDAEANGITPTMTLAQMRARENSATVSANIGLLSVSEAREHSAVYGFGFISQGGWLRTPVVGETTYPWTFYNGVLNRWNQAQYSAPVHPAIHLNLDTKVTATGEVITETNKDIALVSTPDKYLGTHTYTTAANGWCFPDPRDFGIDGTAPINKTYFKLGISCGGSYDTVTTGVRLDVPFEELYGWDYSFQTTDSTPTNPTNPHLGKSRNTFTISRIYSHIPIVNFSSEVIKGFTTSRATKLKITGTVIDRDSSKGRPQSLKLYYNVKGSPNLQNILFADLDALATVNFNYDVVMEGSLPLGEQEIQVYAVDETGLKSQVVTKKFTVEKGNSDPTLTMTDFPATVTQSTTSPFNSIPLKGTTADADVGDSVTVKYTLDGVPALTDQPIAVVSDTFDHNLELPATLTEGDYTLKVWAEDTEGGKSTEQTMLVTVDKTAPVITFSNVTDGETKFDRFKPVVTVTDAKTTATHTMTLNGVAYTGDTITDSGNYSLVVTALDEVGNESTKTVTFTLNQKPYSIKNFAQVSIKKFQEVTFDINDYFKDEEKDPLSIITTNSNDSVVTLEANGKNLKIKAKSQGTSEVTVRVNDGHSDSNILVFQVAVENEIPLLALDHNEWILIDDQSDITISGTINDPDLEKVTITGTINGVTKTFEVDPTTGIDDAWELVWSHTDVDNGVYSTPVVITAEDAFGSTSNVSLSKPIVKVTGSKVDYETIVSVYETDTSELANVWTSAKHKILLDAYEAMVTLEANNTDAAQVNAETLVNALEDGLVKDRYFSKIASSALDWLIANFDKATIADYTRANVPVVTSDTLDHTNELGQKYLKDKPVLVHGDVVLLAAVANEFYDANTANTVTKWLDVYDFVVMLEDGALKPALIDKINDGILTALHTDPLSLTNELLKDHFGINSTDANLSSYQDYLTDIVISTDGTITLTDLENVVQAVDAAFEYYEKFIKKTANDTLKSFIDHIESLVDGTFKTEQRAKFEDLRLLNFVTNPFDQEANDFINLGITIIPSNVPDYQINIDSYTTSQGPATIKIEDIQYVVNVTDSLIAFKKDPSKSNLDQLVDDLSKIDQDSDLAQKVKDEMQETLLDSINKNPENVTIDELEHAGIENLVPGNEHEYQEALKEYQDNIGRDLTIDDTQKVVDAINSLVDAEQNPSPDKFKDAQIDIDKLEDGTLKEKLIDRLKDAAASYIDQNTGNATVDDLELAGIKDVDPNLLPEYQEHLDLYKPLTTEKIQDVVDVINQLEITLQEAKVVEIEKLHLLIKGLEAGQLQDALLAVHTAIVEIVGYETSGTTLNDVTNALNQVTTSTKVYLEEMAKAAESMHISLQAPTDSTVNDAIAAITSLKDGDYKTRLLATAGEAYLDFVQKNPDKATEDELIKAGFDRVRPELIEEYRKGFVSMTDELGTLSRPEIQLIIDVVNSVTDAKSLAKANDAKSLAETLTDSDWKKEVMENINKLIKQFTPSGGGGGTVPPIEKPDGNVTHIEGVITDNGYEFVIEEEKMTGIIKQGNMHISLSKDDLVSINIPHGAVDYADLQKELGQYGLVIQLIKVDEQNYTLTVNSFTSEGEKEITTFNKHLSVSVTGENIVTQASISNKKGEAVVLRKVGNQLLAVPHQFKNNTFIVKTMQTGQFVVVNQQKTFADIKNTFSKSEIEELANRHVVLGSTDNLFNPGRSITRAELAVMIARAMDLQPTNGASFKDTQGKWYEDAVQAVFEAGIVNGKSDTSYAPDLAVTRQEAAAMMARALKYAESIPASVNTASLANYKDANQIGSWAKQDVLTLQSLKIMSGKGDGTFNPTSSLTRAEMAKILNGTLKYAKFM